MAAPRATLAPRVPSLHTIARRIAFAPLALAFALLAAAAEPADFAEVRAADALRISATIERDTPALAALLSDDLHYTNADGRVQSKAQYLASVAESEARYLSVHPRTLQLQRLAPGAVLMTGRADIVAESRGERLRFSLRFLAAWRKESAGWRLASYQSTPLAASAASP